MLVLSRKKDETIIIPTSDGPIIIQPVQIRGDKVRLGVTAPRDIPVHRTEAYAKIHGPEALREILELARAG
jgi:carbon storage regulator